MRHLSEAELKLINDHIPFAEKMANRAVMYMRNMDKASKRWEQIYFAEMNRHAASLKLRII